MFFPEGQVRVHVYGRPVDMRKSYDGLYALTRQELVQDPLNGRLFVFINRRATTREMDWTGLKLLLEGIEAKVVRKRYKRPRDNDAHGIIRA